MPQIRPLRSRANRAPRATFAIHQAVPPPQACAMSAMSAMVVPAWPRPTMAASQVNLAHAAATAQPARGSQPPAQKEPSITSRDRGRSRIVSRVRLVTTAPVRVTQGQLDPVSLDTTAVAALINPASTWHLRATTPPRAHRHRCPAQPVHTSQLRARPAVSPARLVSTAPISKLYRLCPVLLASFAPKAAFHSRARTDRKGAQAVRTGPPHRPVMPRPACPARPVSGAQALMVRL